MFPPESPTIEAQSTTATSVSLVGTVPSGSEVGYYEVTWQRDTSGVCSDEDEGNTTLYTIFPSFSTVISGLEEDSSYFITVTAGNSVGSAVSDSATVTTTEAGIYALRNVQSCSRII